MKLIYEKDTPYQKYGNTKGMRYLMNKSEKLRVNIVKSCVAGEMTVKSAAARLGISVRYMKKLKAKYRKEGEQSMLHGNCGRQSKITKSTDVVQKILETRKMEIFEKVNTKHFQEILEEKYETKVSYSYLRKLFSDNQIKSPRQYKKRKQHKRRERKEHFGELLQVDATPHRFFYNDEKSSTLHGFIDDATGDITGLFMCENECMHGYFEVMKQTIENFGVPEGLYADGSSVFFAKSKQELNIEDELAGVMQKSTQYGKAVEALGVKLIHARSAQAKGRIERLWETLQDRLYVEFQMNNIKTIEEANEFLKGYIKKYNDKFGIPPKAEQSYFVPLLKEFDLDILFSVKYVRTLDNCCCFSLNNVTFQVDEIICTPKTKIEVLINKKIGIKAMHNGKLYKVTPILDKAKKEINTTDSIEMIINRFIYYYCLKNERVA